MLPPPRLRALTSAASHGLRTARVRRRISRLHAEDSSRTRPCFSGWAPPNEGRGTLSRGVAREAKQTNQDSQILRRPALWPAAAKFTTFGQENPCLLQAEGCVGGGGCHYRLLGAPTLGDCFFLVLVTAFLPRMQLLQYLKKEQKFHVSQYRDSVLALVINTWMSQCQHIYFQFLLRNNRIYPCVITEIHVIYDSTVFPIIFEKQ